MIPYLCIIFSPLLINIACNLFSIKQQNKKKIVIWGSFLILFIFQSLRKTEVVGVDFGWYNIFFQEVRRLTWKELFHYRQGEYGFWLLLKLISLLTNNLQIFLSIISFLILFPFAIFYCRYSKLPVITFALFVAYDVFAMTFSGIRQALAIGIILYFFKYVEKKSLKNIIIFYFGVFLACQFHSSAIIAAIIYPIYWIKVKQWMFSFCIILIAFIFIFNKEILSLIFRFLPEKYLIYEDNIIGKSELAGMFVFDLLVFILAFFFLRKDTKGLINIQFLVVCFRAFSPVHALSTRFAFYFIPISTLLIPNGLYEQIIFNKKTIQILEILTFIGSLLLLIFTLVKHDALGIYPYEFFWE